MPKSPKIHSIHALRQHCLALLLLCEADEKALATRKVQDVLAAEISELVASQDIAEPPGLPGRPALPRMVPPKAVPQHSIHSPLGLAASMHAIAHIEFNAINLALDAVWRFSNMPAKYYLDWLGVATEEALHFQLLQERLVAMGKPYGSFPAHQHLWNMVERTRHDIVARMALVPRTLEARGLDATPPLQSKLRRLGGEEALRCADILSIILRDEIGHVAIGNYWYHWLCEKNGLDSLKHFGSLCETYEAPKLRPPLNLPARKAAGFTEEELGYLSNITNS